MKANAKSQLINLIANELHDAEGITQAVVLEAQKSRSPGGKNAYVGPRTKTEDLLARIWADVMKVGRVGVEDGFLDLGGHSLSATQIASRIRANFNVEISLPVWFENPTVANLAAEIDHVHESERLNRSATEPPDQMSQRSDA